ncbi:LysR family transcriptional regulator [uncultured Litoreibacter sp.]|uniref:LysR family transcriptional regulator n=1 Tax=uncultured Litoreibacter sp. TaxID=1392394 RepID=UPI002636C66D|nr:LysR family transcriptional regulator [uncultured Litoreibacter sp.]
MIKNQINLKQLEALVFVADTGTFRKAATALGTTQPNISVRIASLEETLGVVLMHRDAGSVRITERGQEILTDARRVLRTAEELLETAGRQDLIEERLRLGVTELVASTWLHQFMREFRVLYPAIRFELTIDLSKEVENLMSAGELDLAILTEPFRTKSTGSIPVGRYRYGWVTTPEISAQLGPRPNINAVHAKGILSHGKHTLASVNLRAHLEAQGLQASQVIHSSSISAALNMAIDGMGVALLPRQMFKAATRKGDLQEIDCGWEPEPLSFFSRYNKRSAPHFVERAAELSAKVAASFKV